MGVLVVRSLKKSNQTANSLKEDEKNQASNVDLLSFAAGKTRVCLPVAYLISIPTPAVEPSSSPSASSAAAIVPGAAASAHLVLLLLDVRRGVAEEGAAAAPAASGGRAVAVTMAMTVAARGGA